MSTLAMEIPTVLLHTPNYITLMPPGEVLEEKMEEMGVTAEEIAKKSDLPLLTVQQILKAEIPISQDIAKGLETATWIPVENWFMHERAYRKNLEYAKQNPHMPVY